MKVYEPGQRLRDTTYGAGVVLTADTEYTTIRFRQFGVKKFVTSMLQMEAIEDPKPRPAIPPATAATSHPKRIRARQAKPRRSGKSARRVKKSEPRHRRARSRGSRAKRRR